MRFPGTIKCNLCGSEIAHEKRVIKLTVPITEALRKEIVATLRKEPPQIHGKVLDLPVPLEHLVSPEWTLELCGCVIGIIPQLSEAIAADIRHSIKLRERSAELAKTPIERIDDL